MTRVLIAFDKFKDALTARQACDAAYRALKTSQPDWIIDWCPLTDGGEGFAKTLTDACEGRYLSGEAVCGSRGGSVGADAGIVSASQLPETVRARLQLQPQDSVAVLGMAEICGLALLPPEQRNPWHTTSYGVGESLVRLRKKNVDAILIGVGGSATNDLGLGALAAAGFSFLKNDGSKCILPIPARWPEIVQIVGTVEFPSLFIACDVANPLLGPTGATATFGPQKGLPLSDIPTLDAEMARMAALLCSTCNKPFSFVDTPGAGAAGGIALGLMVAANAQIVPGFDLVSEWLGLPSRVAEADLVLTGEGRFDQTSLNGKGPGSLARMARTLGKPAHIFAGSLGVPEDRYHHAITPSDMPLPEALARTAELLTAAVGRVF